MKIRTQFITGMIIFGIMVLVIAASIANMNGQIAQLNGQIEIARRIEQETAELGYLSNDYFLFQGRQQLDRWQSKLDSIRGDISSLAPTSDREMTLAANIDEDMKQLNVVFSEVVAYLADAPRNVSVRIDPEFQISWKRMAVQTQALAFDTSILSQMLITQADQAQQTSILLSLSLFGVFGVYFFANYIVVYRRILKSISELQEGAGVVGSGNFDFNISLKSDDEIGELSQAFNSMTTNLKQVTASKTELEREVSERKRVEEKLRFSNDELSALNEELAAAEEELKASNERVNEYANKLEHLVDERTTELKESEAKLRRVQQVDTVSRIGATVAHDLRGPLNIIFQSLEMVVKQPDLTPKMIESARRSAEKALNMVEEFRAGTREVKIVKRPVDVSTLVKDVIVDVPEKRNVKIDLDLDEGLGIVSLDPDIISRVLDNLIRNAVDAMPNGGKLNVSAHRIADELVLEVSDTGMGIKPEDAVHLFEPLFTTKASGMGFGLYFVRTAVEAHEGSIGFESRVGIGTKFRIKIPME